MEIELAEELQDFVRVDVGPVVEVGPESSRVLELDAEAERIQDLTDAEEGLGGAIRLVLALAESYPDLKASASFVTLQDQLEGTENRIAVERQRYNDAVRQYNSRLRIFPFNVVGGMFGYEPREYFESSLGAEEPVDLGLVEDEP